MDTHHTRLTVVPIKLSKVWDVCRFRDHVVQFLGVPAVVGETALRLIHCTQQIHSCGSVFAGRSGMRRLGSEEKEKTDAHGSDLAVSCRCVSCLADCEIKERQEVEYICEGCVETVIIHCTGIPDIVEPGHCIPGAASGIKD